MGRILFEDNLVHFDLPERLKWVTTTDPEFNKALDYILHTTYNLFINGPAGTGKSVMINLAYNMLRGTKMVLGSTGVSASCLSDAGVPACTIHRGLKVRPQEIFSRTFNPLDRNSVEACEILERVDIVIIEEVGMVSAALFDYIGVLVEEAEVKRGKPIRILCFGDVLQLPPVVKSQSTVDRYYKNYYGKNFFFFNSEFFLRGRFVHLSLETIYRQSNTSFQNILNRLRLNRETDHDLEILNERVVSLTKFKKKHPFSMILAPTRNTVAFLNDKYGRPPEPVEEKAYYAVSDGNFDWDDAGLVEKEVKICVGQQVMCLYNESDRFQNGTLCRVKELHPDGVLAVKSNGKKIFIGKHKWVQYGYSFDKREGSVNARETGAVTQIGCKPATASTIHKAQGLTLESVYLDLEDHWIPESGVYLGLSRCKSLEGIGLSRPISHRDIHILQEPMDFVLGS